jgi:hypothetical protein
MGARVASRVAAGYDFCRGTALVTTAQLDGCSSAPLPCGGGVALCCVRLFVWCVFALAYV